MSTTRRTWDATRSNGKAKRARKSFPAPMPEPPQRAAYKAKQRARRWPGTKQSIGALQAHYEALYGRAPITLPKVSILKDDE